MRRRSAMSLIQLLLVIALIAVLLGLLLPAVQKVREAAARIQTFNNLKQIVLATHAFAGDHSDRLPTIDGDVGSPNYGDSLFVALLPYVDQGNLYQAAKADPSVFNVRVALYISPSDP